jgi:hypothetical protein
VLLEREEFFPRNKGRRRRRRSQEVDQRTVMTKRMMRTRRTKMTLVMMRSSFPPFPSERSAKVYCFFLFHIIPLLVLLFFLLSSSSSLSHSLPSSHFLYPLCNISCSPLLPAFTHLPDEVSELRTRENPLPDFIDPVTLEEVEEPAISPYGHIMGKKTWYQCLSAEPTKEICPFTKQPLKKRDLVVLTWDNIHLYKDKIKKADL